MFFSHQTCFHACIAPKVKKKPSHAKNSQDGVRKMATYAANSMYNSVKGKPDPAPFVITLKYHYSRLFEFMDKAKNTMFQIYGRVLSTYEPHEFVKDEATFGCLWTEPKKSATKAGFLCSFGADNQRFNLLQDCVVVSRAVDESIEKLKSAL